MFKAIKIRRALSAIIDAASQDLPEENIDDARMLAEAGEWGEAIELICTQLCEYDVTVTIDTYEKIEAAGKMLGMPSEVWRPVRGLAPP